MRRLTVILTFVTALPMLVACEREAPEAVQAPAPATEARAEPRAAPEPVAAPREEPVAAPREEPAPEVPGISIDVSIGGFNARAFSSFEACSGAALTVAGERARCRSNCECMGVHNGPESQQSCMVSCSAD